MPSRFARPPRDPHTGAFIYSGGSTSYRPSWPWAQIAKWTVVVFLVLVIVGSLAGTVWYLMPSVEYASVEPPSP